MIIYIYIYFIINFKHFVSLVTKVHYVNYILVLLYRNYVYTTILKCGCMHFYTLPNKGRVKVKSYLLLIDFYTYNILVLSLQCIFRCVFHQYNNLLFEVCMTTKDLICI